jgi:hypothetical protein
MATTFHEKPAAAPVCECGRPCHWSAGGYWMGKCWECVQELRHAFWAAMGE